MSEEKLREVFDRITREVTQNSVGIRLVHHIPAPSRPGDAPKQTNLRERGDA